MNVWESLKDIVKVCGLAWLVYLGVFWGCEAKAFTNLDIMRCEDEHAACIEEAITGIPPDPTPTPRPTNPPPINTPPPSGADCSDGMLRGKPIQGQNLYGFDNVEINPGETKHFCADVTVPIVPPAHTIDRIFTTYADNTDFVCGVIRVTMKQTFHPYKQAGPSSGTSGSVRFNRHQFRAPDCAACVQRGRYTVTVEGIALYDPSHPKCNRFTILWGYH